MKMDRKTKAEKSLPKIKPIKNSQPVASPKTNGNNPLAVYHHLPMGVVESSLKGKYLDANEEFCRLLGYSKKELLRLTIKDCTYEEDYATEKKFYKQLVAGEIPFYRLEKRCVQKDGSSIWVEVTRTLVCDADEKPIYALGVVLDISERKKVEVQTKWQAHLLAELGDAVLVTDNQFVLTGWNKAAERIYGWKAEEVLGKRAEEILQTDFLGKTREQVLEESAMTGAYAGEVTQRRKDGTVIYIEARSMAVRDDHDTIVGYVSVNRDSTERRQTEQSVRESQQLLEATYKNAPIGIVEADINGKHINVNEEFCHILGYDRDELLQSNIKDFTHEDDVAIDVNMHQQLVAGKIPFYRLEKRYLRKQGGEVWVELTRSLVRDPQGKPLYTIGAVLDISDRKHVERVLRDSVERLRLATGAAHMFMWEWNLETQLYIADENYEKVLGFRGGLLPKGTVESVQALLPLEDQETLSKAVKDAVESHSDLRVLQIRIMNPENGETIWVEISGKILYDEAGNAVRILGVTQNVTGRTQAQEKLRESEERFRAIISQATAGICESDIESRITFVNPTFCEMLGYPESELLGKTIWELTYTEDLEENKRLFQRMISRGEAYQFEKRFIRRDGSMLWTNVSVSTIRDSDGNAKGGVGVVININERRQAEQALKELARQQEALYQLADQLHRTLSFEGVFSAALDAIIRALQCDRASILLYDHTYVMRFVAWRGLSEDYRKATDGHSPWTPDTKDPSPIAMDDVRLADLTDSLRATIQAEGIGSLAFIPLVSNGKLIGKFMVYFDTPHTFSEGEMDLSLTIAHQLAFGIERRRSEEALARERELLERLFETMPVMVSMYDPETNTLQLNAEFERRIGWRTEDVNVLSLLESMYPDPDYRSQVIKRMAAAGRNDWVDVQVQTRDGHMLDTMWSNISILNGRQIGIGIDITERRLTEQKILQLNSQLQARLDEINALLDILPVGVWIGNEDASEITGNAAAYEMLGLPSGSNASVTNPNPQTPEGLRLFVNGREVEPDDAPMQHVARTGRSISKVEHELRFADGSSKFTYVSIVPLFDQDGAVRKVIGAYADITERKQAENRLSLLANVSEMLRNFEEPQELMYAVSKAIGEHFQLKRCMFNEIDSENDLEIVHRDFYNGVPSVEGVHRISDYSSITTADMLNGRTVVNHDSKTDPRTKQDYERTYQKSRERAYVAVPLMREHRWIASLWASDDEPRPWSQDDVSLLESIAERTWVAVEKLRLMEELRAKENELEEIINHTPFMLTRCSRDLRYRFVSQAYAEMIGRTPDEVAGKPLREVMGEKGLQTIAPYIERVLQGETVEYEAEVSFEDVGAPFLHVVYTPDRDEQGNVIGWFASIVDISERKRIEEALRIENERFMRFVDSNIIGILIGNAKGEVTLANDYYLRLLGVDREEFMQGKVDWKKFTPPEWLPADEAAIREMRERGVCEPYEKEYIRADGTRVPVYIADAMLPGPEEEIAAFVLDITERKRAEEALRESEERFRAILRQATAGIVRKDEDGRLIFVNQAFCNMLGYTEADLLGKTVWDFMHEEDIAENRRSYQRMMMEGVPFKLERRLLRSDGSVIWVDASVSPIMDVHGKPQSAVAIEVDITARKQAEAALQQLNLQLEERVLSRTAKLRSVNQTLRDEIAERKRVEEALRQSEATARSNEEKLSTLFDLLPVGISFLDPEGQIIQMNSALQDILRLSKEQLLSQFYRERKYIRADGTPMPSSEFASVRALTEEKTIHNVETGILLEDGEVIWTNVSAAPVAVADVGAVVVTVNITDSKRAERALQESHRRLRVLSQRLVEVQEEERRALARELHDRVGQTLAALNINLIIINGQLTPEVAHQIGTRLNDSMKLVAETIALVRDVMTDLRPAVLDDYGLTAALESHVAQFMSRYDIYVKFEKPEGVIPRLGPSIEMTFLRIAQEALINIARHARATQVTVSLWHEEETVHMAIEDNGIGIESWQDANRPGSHGLTIMRERADAFDGNLKVRSVAGQGTKIELSVPIKAQREAREEKRS